MLFKNLIYFSGPIVKIVPHQVSEDEDFEPDEEEEDTDVEDNDGESEESTNEDEEGEEDIAEDEEDEVTIPDPPKKKKKVERTNVVGKATKKIAPTVKKIAKKTQKKEGKPAPLIATTSTSSRTSTRSSNKGKKKELKLTFDAEHPIQEGEDLSDEGKYFSLHKSHKIGGNYTATLTTITRRNSNKKGEDKRGEVIGKSLCMCIKRSYTDGKNDFSFNLPCERIEPLYKVMSMWLGRSYRKTPSNKNGDDGDDDDEYPMETCV